MQCHVQYVMSGLKRGGGCKCTWTNVKAFKSIRQRRNRKTGNGLENYETLTLCTKDVTEKNV